jgi:acetoacetyl-CoA synthetase
MESCVWKPTEKDKKNSKLWEFILWVNHKESLNIQHYTELHQWSIKNIASFWQYLAEFLDISFASPPTQILNKWQHPMGAQWFFGATFNFAQQLLLRNDDKPALICVNERDERASISYRTLNEQVASCAAALKSLGIKKEDTVVGVLPNTHYAVIAMLACASIGAVWASCSSDFGSQAIIDRLGQISPKVLFIADGHFYNGKTYDATSKITNLLSGMPSITACVICKQIYAHAPQKRQQQLDNIVLSNPQNSIAASIIQWDSFLIPKATAVFEPLSFNHPLYILFSSGTTGEPKCMVHSAGGTLLQHMKELALHCNLSADDNLLFYTTTGWMMWNWMVSALSLGTSLTLYEGSPTSPNPSHLFDIIEQEKVTHFGTGAKYLSAIEKLNVEPIKHHKLDALKMILATGSPLLPKNYDYVMEKIKPSLQLCSISGGSDIISCFALGNPISAVYRGELQGPGLGMDVCVFDNNGKPVFEEKGELVCRQPFPSMPIKFWNDPQNARYFNSYYAKYEGVWAHGDFASITANNGLIIYGRSDTVLNPGGVRIGTAEIYRQVEKISEILDSVVVGQVFNDDERVILFVQMKPGVALTETLKKTIRHTIREHTSPRHVPAKIIEVPDIPRTLSGKVVELAVKKIISGEKIQNTASLANPEALDYFSDIEALQE